MNIMINMGMIILKKMNNLSTLIMMRYKMIFKIQLLKNIMILNKKSQSKTKIMKLMKIFKIKMSMKFMNNI